MTLDTLTCDPDSQVSWHSIVQQRFLDIRIFLPARLTLGLGAMLNWLRIDHCHSSGPHNSHVNVVWWP